MILPKTPFALWLLGAMMTNMGHVEDRWTRPTGEVDKRGRPVREHTERYGRGLRYVAMWTEGVARKSKSFRTKDAAEAHLADVARGQRDGTHVQTHKLTVAEYGDQWVESQIHQRPSSREQMMSRWTKHIRPTLGDIPLKELTRPRVQAAVNQWDHTDDLSPATISVIYGYVAAIMRSAMHDKLIADTPCVKINLPARPTKRIVPLTVAQVWQIADRIDPPLRFLVILGAASGMRSGELRGLTTDRILWPDTPTPLLPTATIRVDRQLATTDPAWAQTKTDRSDRDVVIDPHTAAAYREHVGKYPPHPSGLIFPGTKSAGLARNVISEAWADATKDMGLPPRSGLHSLRHHHASLLIAAGLSVTAVADRLGHQDPRMTLQVYSHLWATDEARAVNAIASQLWA